MHAGITVGQLIEHLKVFDPASVLVFGDRALQFSRLKHRGTDTESGAELVQLEFVEQVYRDRSGRLIAEDV